eukprot:366197-Chlamydomonas_euryale.AAC.18
MLQDLTDEEEILRRAFAFFDVSDARMEACVKTAPTRRGGGVLASHAARAAQLIVLRQPAARSASGRSAASASVAFGSFLPVPVSFGSASFFWCLSVQQLHFQWYLAAPVLSASHAAVVATRDFGI